LTNARASGRNQYEADFKKSLMETIQILHGELGWDSESCNTEQALSFLKFACLNLTGSERWLGYERQVQKFFSAMSASC
jgi:hypothetical protein